MAGGAARSLDRSGEITHAGSQTPLRLVAGRDETRPAAIPVAGVSALLAPALSASSEVPGLRRTAWLGAGVLYSSAVAGMLLLELPVKPPEPWPDDQAVFQMVFEPPAAPAEPTAAMPEIPRPPEPQTVAAMPEDATALTDVSPTAAPQPDPVVVAEPDAQPEPPPPPRKPAVPQAASKAPAPAPSSAPISAALAASQPSAGAQIAVLSPPAVEQPLVPPRPVGAAAGNVKPDYPSEARRRGQQGRVLLHVDVSAAGAPISVTVSSSSGHELLDQAALRAVSAWRFTPATRGGSPVAGTVDVPVQFRLED